MTRLAAHRTKMKSVAIFIYGFKTHKWKLPVSSLACPEKCLKRSWHGPLTSLQTHYQLIYRALHTFFKVSIILQHGFLNISILIPPLINSTLNQASPSIGKDICKKIILNKPRCFHRKKIHPELCGLADLYFPKRASLWRIFFKLA